MIRARPILVVEDCDEDFETVLDAARRAGVPNPICRAASGDECLRLLRGATQEPQWAFPAFVLLDLNSPQGDGRDVLRKIKQDERLRAILLVVLSTSANPRDLAFCYANGANAYHIKPVIHTAHLQILEKIFGYWLSGTELPTLPT
jgi:CheY-like chemotaxis protein